MWFPAPPAPSFPADQVAVTEGHLRYEDVTQDGRLMPLGVPPSLGGLWRTALIRHPLASAAAQAGIIPMLTRLTIVALDQHIRVDRPFEAHGGFQLAHDRDAAGEVTRLFLNAWSEIRGRAGRIVPRTPAGPLTPAGRLFAEHTYTRPFAPPGKRRVTGFGLAGHADVPEVRYEAPAPTTAGDAPPGAVWLDELTPDPGDYVFTLDQTDSNQHVNSQVYIRVFLDAVNRRLATVGRSLAVCSREVDIAYRKPCFAGDRVRAHLRLFDHEGTLGAAGFLAVLGEEARPRCYVRTIITP